jgi:hypothetical protein
MTKETFAKTVSKVVPVVGGAISGGLTYASFKPGAERLRKYLRSLPTSGIDQNIPEVVLESKFDGAISAASEKAGEVAHVAAGQAQAAGKVAAEQAQTAGAVIADGAKAAAPVIADGAQVAGAAIADGAKIAGGAIADGAQAAGSAIAGGAQAAGAFFGSFIKKDPKKPSGEKPKQLEKPEHDALEHSEKPTED